MHLRAVILKLYQVKSYILCVGTNFLLESKSETDSRNSDVSDEIIYIEEVHSIEQDQQDISQCFQSVGISNESTYAQPLSGGINLSKRKLNTAISTIQEKVARALHVTPEEITLDTSTTEDASLLQIKAENFDRLMQLIKEKLLTIKTNTEIISNFRNLVNQKSSKFL